MPGLDLDLQERIPEDVYVLTLDVVYDCQFPEESLRLQERSQDCSRTDTICFRRHYSGLTLAVRLADLVSVER